MSTLQSCIVIGVIIIYLISVFTNSFDGFTPGTPGAKEYMGVKGIKRGIRDIFTPYYVFYKQRFARLEDRSNFCMAIANVATVLFARKCIIHSGVPCIPDHVFTIVCAAMLLLALFLPVTIALSGMLLMIIELSYICWPTPTIKAAATITGIIILLAVLLYFIFLLRNQYRGENKAKLHEICLYKPLRHIQAILRIMSCGFIIVIYYYNWIL